MTAFFRDPLKFPTGRYKVNLARLTLDDQLKTTYNTSIYAYPGIMTYWRKFKR